MPLVFIILLIPYNVCFPSIYRFGKDFWLLELSFYRLQKILKLGSSLLLFVDKVQELARLDPL